MKTNKPKCIEIYTKENEVLTKEKKLKYFAIG